MSNYSFDTFSFYKKQPLSFSSNGSLNYSKVSQKLDKILKGESQHGKDNPRPGPAPAPAGSDAAVGHPQKRTAECFDEFGKSEVKKVRVETNCVNENSASDEWIVSTKATEYLVKDRPISNKSKNVETESVELESGGLSDKRTASSYRSFKATRKRKFLSNCAGANQGNDDQSLTDESQKQSSPCAFIDLTLEDDSSPSESVTPCGSRAEPSEKIVENGNCTAPSVVSDCDSNSSVGSMTDDDDSDDDEFSGMGKKRKSSLLSFFEMATCQELEAIHGCSAKKAAKLISLRPFVNWNDLVSKLENTNALSTKLIWDGEDILKERSMLDELMNKCERISKKINDKIPQNKQITAVLKIDNNDIIVPDADCEIEQPALLSENLELKHYQLVGLKWLVTLHDEGVNGILADQMGLGKTVQALAFLGYLIENGHEGPHAIIVPSSTCDNWIRELKTWLPSVNYVHYVGSQEERRYLREDILYGDEEYNVIVSTYNLAIGTVEDRIFFRRLNFHYVILDEAHMLKNMESQRYQHLMKIKGKRRLLLTGTPLQNDLLELMSLLFFVMPEMFSERAIGIKRLFKAGKSKSDVQSSYEKQRIKQAKQIMNPFILRRLKKNVLQDLPPKSEEVVYCNLMPEQQLHYDDIIKKYHSLVNEKVEYSNALSVMMQLRKISNHPLLERHNYDNGKLVEMANDYVKRPENYESEVNLVFEDMTVMSDFELHNMCIEKSYLSKYSLPFEKIASSGKFKQLDSLLTELKTKGDRLLMFSQFTQMMDIMEPFLEDRGHSYLRLDGQTAVNERQQLIDEYNSNSNIFIFLLSTKAGGLGINLTSANVVILHDIDFNPYNDKQAEDRCHRVGQKRNVRVYKLIAKGTIEEDILNRANRKLKLEQDLTGDIGQESPEVKEDLMDLIRKALSK